MPRKFLSVTDTSRQLMCKRDCNKGTWFPPPMRPSHQWLSPPKNLKCTLFRCHRCKVTQQRTRHQAKFEQMLDPFPLCWDACCLDFTKSIPESGGVIVPSGPTTPPPGVWIEENPGTTARLFSEDYISHFRGSHAGSLPKFSKCPSACFSLSVLNSNKLTLHLQTVAIVVLSDIFRRLLWWVWLYQGGRKKSKLGPGVFLSAVRVLEEVRMRKSTPWSFGCRRWTWTWTQCSRRPNQPEAGHCMLQFFTYMCLVQNFRRMTQSNQVRISRAFYKWAVLCPKHHLLTMSFPPALNRLFSGTFPHSWLPIQYPLPGRREHPW